MKYCIFALIVLFASASTLAEEDYSSSPEIIPVENGLSGKGTTTHYWDCCKPACGSSSLLPNKSKPPVKACAIDGVTHVSNDAQSGCEKGGNAFACINQSSWMVNRTLSYGFAGFSFNGGSDTKKCCSCMLLKFQGELLGKSMVVQVINKGSDYHKYQFDLATPGGGVGINNACTKQWHAPADGWGRRYGGVRTRQECDKLPQVLVNKCKWRFDFFGDNIDNPTVEFVEVQCPKQLTDLTGCYP